MTHEETVHKFEEVIYRLNDFERLLRINQKDWYTIKEAAFILDISEASLNNLVYRKRIDCYKKEGMRTFTKQQLEDYRLKGARLKEADYHNIQKKLDELKEQERILNKKLRRLKRLELLADELIKDDDDEEDNIKKNAPYQL